jgi:hypothetical protein
MSKRLSGVLYAVLTLLSFNVHAVTIDFESLVNGINPGTTYTESGFTISATSLIAVSASSAEYHGSPALRNGIQSNTPNTTLTVSGGGTFNLTSIDLAEVGSNNMYIATINFTGHQQDGGMVHQSFTLDGIYTTGNPFETLLFTNFNNLTSLTWDNRSPYHQFDNIVASVVPLPAAVWLFGSGLLGILGITRRRRSA